MPKKPALAARAAATAAAIIVLDSGIYFYKTGNMESAKTVRALGALAHDSRLAIYRLLVRAGKAGLAVGAIAEQLQIPAATLSFHLAGLRHAGLVTARREGRTLYQAADYRAINDLVGYLLENCCGGADCGLAAGAAAKPGSRSIRQESRHAKTARTRRRR